MTGTEKIERLKELKPQIQKYLMYASQCKEEKRFCTEADMITELCTKIHQLLK